ncbi:MAG: hypothetical protein FWE59_06715 [Oscillospiraceae bacterium]|nr:hypothetical protein [Oscillospiraceae bacterium]
MHTGRSKMKTALALILCAALLLTVTVPAAASQKISNPGNFSGIDGIDTDPEVGVHNSYAWCAEMFAQTDGDYLWVGTNRDMGRIILNLADVVEIDALTWIAELLGKNAGLPEMSEDTKGKIYRQRAADSDAPWELMYENPAINGYRRMILFKGDLYVCAGLTNTPDYDYSVILRFKPGFKAGGEPEVVLWESLPRNDDGNLKAMEYFRAACVYEDRLYIGTFDSKIYVTDGAGLTGLTPGAGEKSTGWELFANLRQHPDFQAITEGPLVDQTYVWDMVGFNGSIYAAVTYFGFNMFKLTPQTGGAPPVIKQVVGNSADAKYPNGVGMEGLVSASPYTASFGGKEYVYVSTYANGPSLLGNLALGQVETAFDELMCPPSIFRFDSDDNWELVAGDTAGKFVPVDKAGNQLPRLGNQRAGFSAFNDKIENLSFNQYIWWMTQYDGKLYASTWDLGVFKRQNPALVIMGLLSAVVFSVSGALLSLFAVAGPALSLSGGPRLAQTGLRYADGDGAPSGGGLILELFMAVPRAVWAMLKTIPMWMDASKYMERTNPYGFDLFVSEDGVNFEPVTVNGLGNGENYGGRVLLPTQYGLFVCTANPFGGAQVWRLDDIRKELQPNIPAVVQLKVGETFKGTLRGLDMPNGAAVSMTGASDYANIALEHRKSTTIIDTTNKILRIGPQYLEFQSNKKHPVQMFDVVFTGTAAGVQDVTLRFSWNGVEAAKTVKVIVTDIA